MTPFFTVVTITYNSSKYIRQAIESVLAQSYNNFEYLISDDCSNDNTWEIIQEYNDTRIRSWRNEFNLGEYTNRNKTLYEAKGKYIFWLDGDDIFYKNSLRDYKELINNFPSTAAIWGVSQLQVDFIVFPYLFSPEEITRFNFLSLYPITLFGFAETLFNREILISIGGLKENYMIGDTYIKRRMACEYAILVIPAGKSFWRKTSNQATQRVQKNLINLIETFKIDYEILTSNYFPLKGEEYKLAFYNFKTDE